jgi:glycosyltransferase involved in cell wall biosynthesis
VRVLYLTRGYTAHDHRFLAKLAQTANVIGYARLEPASSGDDPHPVPDGITRLSLDEAAHKPRWSDYPRLRRRLRAALDEFSPEVVHAGPVQSGGLLAAWAGVKPLVTMSWGSDVLWDAKHGLGRLATRYTLARTSVFVCDCQAVREAGIALGAPAGRVVVFPWGVDLRRFSPGDGLALRRRLGWEDAFVLVSTRTWERLYGLDTLVEGFVRAARHDDALRLLMLGQGSLEPWIRARLAESGMAERVHFAGKVGLEDLPSHYRAADLYVSASRTDGSSVSLLEAMACGLPALVSDIAGNREWVAPRENGWWFRTGDAEALAEGILDARRSKAGPAELGRRGRAIAEARADWDRNFPLLLDAYQMAIEQGRTA